MESDMMACYATILVVENNPIFCKFLRILFEGVKVGKLQFKLEECRTLKDALIRLETNGIDVILTGLQLSDSDGVATFEKIYNKAKHIPIIVLTMLDDDDLAVEIVEQGAEDFITKGSMSNQSFIRLIRLAIARDKRNNQKATVQAN